MNGTRMGGRSISAGIAVLGAAMLALGGCASVGSSPGTDAAPAPKGHPPAEVAALWEELRRTAECVSEVENQPAFLGLKQKTPDDDTPLTSPLFTTSALATDKEKAEIAAFSGAIARCRPAFPGIGDADLTERAGFIHTVWDHQQELYAALQSGRMAWGQFNQVTRTNARRLTGMLANLEPPGPVAADNNPAPPPIGSPVAEAPSVPHQRAIAVSQPVQQGAPSAPMAAAAVENRASNGPYRLHLASYRGQSMADRGWQMLQPRVQQALGPVEKSAVWVEIPGRGRYLRLMVGSFADPRQAEAACAAVARVLEYCAVMP